MKLMAKGANVPLPRGPMMTAGEVATELYSGKVKARWVLENVRPKIRVGHRTVLFYRDDVLAFIESQRESAA